ncbi:MlaD family protein [Kiritimatiellaeota bacterium B1221]|nr:MlaD family protein [Kiritimatiellaeota bacterium B1221]
MSKKINPAKLGVFVLIAIVLGLTTLAVISSGQLFKKTIPFVMYFDADATGLKPGAPVLYRGVAVGQVTKIQLIFDSDLQDMLVPVHIEIDPNRFVLQGSSDHYPMMEDLINEGLRAQLQTQSFVTGMLQVMLVTMPEIPLELKGVNSEIREIPTAPALTQILTNEIKELNLSEMLSDMQETLKSAKQITENVRDEKLFENLSDVLENLNSLTEDLAVELPKVSKDITQTSTSIREFIERGSNVLSHAETLMTDIGKQAPGILQGAKANTDKLQELQTTLTSAVKQAEGMLAHDSPLRFHMAAALDRYTKVATKLETLLDTIERNPEAFITGKPEQN